MCVRARAERVLAAIEHDCSLGLDARTLRIAVVEHLSRVVEFDWYVWVLTDPVSCVGVDPLSNALGVIDLGRTIRLKYATPVNRWTTLPGVAVLGTLAPTSRLWREIQSPLGVVDVASMVFRDPHGCWGFLDLWLRAPLCPDQLWMLRSALPGLTRTLRSARAETLRRPPDGMPEHYGPATLLMDTDLTIKGATEGMADRLTQLLPRTDGLPPVPAAALNAGAQLLAVEEGIDSHEPEARTHFADGHWVTVRAARLRPSAMITVSVEPTTPVERLDLFIRAFALTAREGDIVKEVVRGLDTAAMARDLYLSPYTIQDHLKSIFSKIGVDSRRELVSLLVG